MNILEQLILTKKFTYKSWWAQLLDSEKEAAYKGRVGDSLDQAEFEELVKVQKEFIKKVSKLNFWIAGIDKFCSWVW